MIFGDFGSTKTTMYMHVHRHTLTTSAIETCTIETTTVIAIHVYGMLLNEMDFALRAWQC
jgi:hypothetical protein